MVRWRSVCLLLVAVALVGCPKEEEDDGSSNITIDDTSIPDEDGGSDMGDGGGGDMQPSDVPVFRPDVEDLGPVSSPGFMHGEWEVTRRSDDAFLATLALRHEDGETTMTGTYEMEEPASFGRLAGTTWVDDVFTTSWTVDVEGSNERFGLSDCATMGSDDLLVCRYSSTLAGNIIDANMTRQ